MEGGSEGGRKGGRAIEREGDRERGREEGREEEREGGSEGGRKRRRKRGVNTHAGREQQLCALTCFLNGGEAVCGRGLLLAELHCSVAGDNHSVQQKPHCKPLPLALE